MFVFDYYYNYYYYCYYCYLTRELTSQWCYNIFSETLHNNNINILHYNYNNIEKAKKLQD